MPFDLNRKRRASERAIANEIADEIARHVTPTTDITLAFLAPHVSAVFERLGLTPSEREVIRIVQYASKEMVKRKQYLRTS